MRVTRFRPAIITAVLLAAAPAALAQFGTAFDEPEPPYVGRVTVENAIVRSGPGAYYYPVVQLGEDTTVNVLDREGDWLKIAPPADTYGLVKAEEVQVGQDGLTATATESAVRVYAHGPRADRHWSVAKEVRQGDKLAVRATAPAGLEEMIEVRLPEGTGLYIASALVEATEQAVPGDGEAGDGEVPEIPEIDVESAEHAAEALEAWQAADQAYAEELAKPIMERDYDALAARFRKLIETTEKAYIGSAARQRLAQIETLKKRRREYEQVRELPRELERKLAEIDAREAASAAEETAEGPGFQAEGVVMKLLSVEGTDSAIRHRLVGREGTTVALVRSDTYDLNDYAGKAVGVRGDKRYSKQWGANVIVVDDLEVLE